MPRKTKEQNELDNLKNDTKKAKTTSKSTISKTKKGATTKKASSSKTVSKTEVKKTAKAVKETTSTKKKTTTSKTSKKADTKTSTKKTTTNKSTVTTAKKSTTRKPRKKKVEIVEYYDLPEKYNQTTVKLLAQTPNSLFVYWDISDEDKDVFRKQYGDDFFQTTTPILIIHNDTMGYSFEVDINDYANSWYLKVQDSKCDYRIELGRKFLEHNLSNNIDNSNYVHVYTSNKLENPNDKILFNINQKMVYFKNTKTSSVTSKDVSSLSHIQNIGKIYNIYDLYKTIFKTENLEDIYNLKNPSSAGSQSFTKEFNHE